MLTIKLAPDGKVRIAGQRVELLALAAWLRVTAEDRGFAAMSRYPDPRIEITCTDYGPS